MVPLPLGFHYGAALLAAWCGRNRATPDLSNLAPYIAWSINGISICYGITKTYRTTAVREKTRTERNEWIDDQVQADSQLYEEKMQSMQFGNHELSLEQLQNCRFLVNLTRQPLEAWEGWSSIDQFRESGYRYQIYFLVYFLAAVQCNVLPNFHGYVSEAQRTAIEKCLQPAVQYYWILESIWGRFSLNWDPIKTDK